MINNASFKRYYNKIEAALFEGLGSDAFPEPKIGKAMRYSLESGGKRIRPIILLAFCELCGGNADEALPFALALEYIHTYSLIHDDLPCMDNSDLRRGRPSNHKVFGETAAVLAGDGLLNFAFESMLGNAPSSIPAELRLRAAGVIAAAAGVGGMIGGQAIDTIGEAPKTLETLERMDLLKTGALIRAAGEAGCILAGASKEQIEAAVLYCESIGLAFQIKDDLLDIKGSSEALGKPTMADQDSGKVTYASLLGAGGCEREIKRLTDKAKQALDIFENADFLFKLSEDLSKRSN
jgi:geranylgeranyl diphosphate synthase type II